MEERQSKTSPPSQPNSQPGSISRTNDATTAALNGSPPVPHSTSKSASTTANVAPGHEASFVSPATFLQPIPSGRPRASSRPVTPAKAAVEADKQDKPPPKIKRQIDRDEELGLKKIRDFLRARTAYDVLPLSFRLIELDVSLTVKESLQILVQCGKCGSSRWT
jgi:5'-AMP-activated protein kinase, regulatory gamma subunit